MKEQLKELLFGIFIYSSGQFVSRLVNFLLLPLVTNYLNPSDYGIIGQLTLMAQLLTSFFTLGFAVSISRAYWATEEAKERHEVIWTGFFTLCFHCTLLVFVGSLFSPMISRLLFGTDKYFLFVIWMLMSEGFSNAMLPFQTWLRMEKKALTVVVLSLVEIFASVIVTLYCLIVLKMGCKGQILGGLFGQILSFTLMFLVCAFRLKFSVKIKKHVPDMIKLGAPYIVGFFGYFMLQCSGRYILQKTHGLDEVGLFFMGQNFGRVVDLAVLGFIAAWPPFAYQYLNRKEEAIVIFGKVLSYYVLGMGVLIAGIFAIAKPLVFLMVNPQYYSVWKIVGLNATSQTLWGVYGISAIALVFYKKTIWQAIIEIVAGGCCIAFCSLLSPLYGKEGATIGSLSAYIALLCFSFPLNLRLLPVRYEIKKVLRVSLAVVAVAVISFLPVTNMGFYIGMMSAALGGFFVYLWFFCYKGSIVIGHGIWETPDYSPVD